MGQTIEPTLGYSARNGTAVSSTARINASDAGQGPAQTQIRKRRVSVIIPTRDRPDFLAEAMTSVRALEGPDLEFEILIGDNGSNPDTPKVAERFGARYFKVERQGAAAARNAGMRAATGDYIAHLDDDDLWTADHVRPHLALMEANPEIYTVVGRILCTDTERKPIGEAWPQSVPDHGDLFMTFMSYFPQVGGTISRAAVRETVGLFDETLLGDADWDWQLRIAKKHRIGFAPVTCVLFRQRPSGEADAVHLRRIPHTRRIFLRHALPEWRRWNSPTGLYRSYNKSMAPYFIYFVNTAHARAERGDYRGALAAIGHAVKLVPVRGLREFARSSDLRGSLFRAVLGGRLSQKTH
ncbi:MAG TPA: glycosyltransferase family 2 protein [Polyangiaceae bacterium]|nr:glycosyltransferase family 2 protein [Polyangiaceae bacterium]